MRYSLKLMCDLFPHSIGISITCSFRDVKIKRTDHFIFRYFVGRMDLGP